MYRDQCSKTLYRTPLQPGWWLEGNQAMKSLKLLMFAALMVAMARALINEPDFVNRMKNEGEERCACTHANYCIARMYSIEMACHKHLHDLPCPVRREVERLDREAWQ